MGEDDKTLEEGCRSMADTLRIKQEFQRVLIDGIGVLPGEHLDQFAERIVRELQSWRTGARRRSLPAIESVPDVTSTAAALARESRDEERDHGELMRRAASKLADIGTAAAALLAERDTLRWLHAEAAHERDRERASRQAWSTEALKWEHYSQLPRSAIDLVVFNDALGRPVCACISDDQASQLGPGFSRPVCAEHPEPREPRVFPVGSPEPADVLCVRSSVNHVVFQHWPNWGKWRAMEDSGGDGDFYHWHRLNAGADGAEMVEVFERAPLTPWAEGGEPA